MKGTLLRGASVAAACVLALSGTALADGAATTTTTTTTTTPATTAPTTTPVVTQAKAKPALYTGGLFTVNHAPVTVPGRSVTISGVVRPYVAGQRVLLKALDNGKLFRIVKYNLKRSKRGTYGGFTTTITAPSAGNVSVQVVHSATAALSGFTVKQSFTALDESVNFGSVGPMVDLIQQRLLALHFYLPDSGVYDQHTGLAMDAYHRLLGWGYSQLPGPATINALLNGEGTFTVKFPNQGVHAEGDLSDQLLALTDGSKVQWILPISSGKPSTPTVLGSWRIYLRDPGYLSDGMYYSSFFTGGYAIHGYDPAPDYPASHGCMRLPIVDAIFVYDWLNYGDWVDTYYT